MSDDGKRSKLEHLKETSRQLRGTIAEELENPEPFFSADAAQLLKHHGSYMQDDRDVRRQKNEDGTKKEKAWSCMVRTRIPGGRVTADQFLAELDLCDRLGAGTVRITSRQGFQLHGVLKKNLRQTIRDINASGLTTLAACGDVNRNVMCCPAPVQTPVRRRLQELAQELADHFRPRTTAYRDIWLIDDEDRRIRLQEPTIVEEPIYGTCYLPRKFKMAIALPEDNCVDVYTQDIGLLAIAEQDHIVGYNVIVGGGMGRTPSAEKTFPALGQPLACVAPDQVVAVCEAIVCVQRDYGNRADRKRARMKYLVADWGLPRFRSVVEEYYGQPLNDPQDVCVTGVEDHIGWHEQGDGRLFLGINIENGRIQDTAERKIKTGLRAVISQYRMDTRLTALQSVILCDIDPADRMDIDRMLAEHGIPPEEDLSLLRRYSMACPAFPTCGLSITEAERVLPGLIDQLDAITSELGLEDEKIAVHMTGCPNGCARPYTPDVGLVGRSVGKYTVFLGGNAQGTRLAFVYDDQVPLDEIADRLRPLLTAWRDERQAGESFGDYCHRIGRDGLRQRAA